MEQINFDSNKQVIQKLINLRNQDVSIQNSQTQNVKFDDLLSDISNNQSDSAKNIIKNLSQKYHVNITVTPNETNKNVIHEGQFNISEDSGYNNSVIIPRNLLNKMATDPKTMKSVEFAIKSDIDGFKQGETFRTVTGDKSLSSPLTFNEDGTWEKWGMTSSTSDNSNLASKKIGITQSEQEESSDNTAKNNQTTSEALSSGNSTQTDSLHHNTIRFVIENGMASYVYVDGIKMEVADMILPDKIELKKRIIEKYNKTEAEILEEAFGL